MKSNFIANDRPNEFHERASSQEHRLFVFPDSYIIDCGTRPRFVELDMPGLRKIFRSVAGACDESVPNFVSPICDSVAELVLDRFQSTEAAYAEL